MMSKLLSPIRLLFFVALCAGFGVCGGFFEAIAEVDSAPAAEYVWSAPTYGTAVEYYVAEVMINDVDIQTLDPLPSEYVSVEVVFGNKYRIRVAAVDKNGIQGPFSPWSAPFTPELAPPQF